MPPDASAPPLTPEFKAFWKWAEQAILEADAFLKAQQGFEQFDETISAMHGELSGDLTQGLLGGVTYNHLGKVALEMVAAQTDIKPFWDYSTQNHRFDPQVAIANKLAKAWWMGRHVTLPFSDIIKLCLPMGTGYAHQVYNSANSGFGGGYQGGDIELLPEDPRDVLPIRPGSLYSLQESAGVIVRRERTVNWIRAKHGEAAKDVRADREGSIAQINASTRYGKLMSTLGLRTGFMDNLLSSLGVNRTQASPLNVPSADYYTMYVNDPSINESSQGRWMGLHNGMKTSWSYYVPGRGELHWSWVRGRDGSGEWQRKPARDNSEFDSPLRLYPRKRQIIFTRTARIYDDTSPYLHGLFPLAKLTLDPWPGLWLGKAPLKDLMPLHREMQKLMRVFSRHLDRIKRPGIAGDKEAISEKDMKKIDPEMPGLKLRLRPTNGKPIEMLYEPALDAWCQWYFQLLKQGMSDLGGSSAAAEMIAELNQIPQMETIDKLTAMEGMVNKLRSLVIEQFMSEFAMMLLSNFFQFYTREQRIAVLGPAGQTFEDFDFDPESLIPGDIIRPMPDGTPAPRGERAREFFRYFTYQIAPGSLLNSASMQEKMLYMQLARTGAIDLATLLEKLNIPNLGLPADFPIGVMQRLQWQQQNGIGLAVNSAGRKSSGQQGPRMKMSESG